MFQPYGMATY